MFSVYHQDNTQQNIHDNDNEHDNHKKYITNLAGGCSVQAGEGVYTNPKSYTC